MFYGDWVKFVYLNMYEYEPIWKLLAIFTRKVVNNKDNKMNTQNNFKPIYVNKMFGNLNISVNRVVC